MVHKDTQRTKEDVEKVKKTMFEQKIGRKPKKRNKKEILELKSVRTEMKT